MRKTIRSAVVGLAGITLSSVLAAAPPQMVQDDCSNCHGDTGVSTDYESVPTIAGMSAFFLENQMFMFQESARPCAEDIYKEINKEELADNHCMMAKQLSEEEILDIAAYFADQEFKSADQPVDQSLADTGAKIHEQRCDKCHSEGGSLVLDDAGLLAGQWKPYLAKTMKDYMNGDRWQPEKMQPQMEELTEAHVQALAEYYASQGK